MASNINPNSINVNFPLAGQAQSSQGFRDNFLALKTALTTAKTELTGILDSVEGVDARVVTVESVTTDLADLVASGSLLTEIEATVQTNYDDLAALITLETTARTDADEALAEEITTLSASINTNITAELETEALARATEDAALAALITTLTTSVNANTSDIEDEIVARTTALDALASRTTTLEAKVVPNPNLLYNATFAVGLDGWTSSRSTGTDWTTQNNGGDYSVVYTANLTSGLHYNGYISTKFNVTAGETYAVAADLLASGLEAGALRFNIKWYDVSNAFLSNSSVISATLEADWARLGGTFVAPGSATKAAIYFELTAGTNTMVGIRRIKAELGTLHTPFSDEATTGAVLTSLLAQITTEASARATQDTALSTLITTLTATVADNDTAVTALVTDEATARADADDALASDITALTSTVSTNNTDVLAAITTEATARADADDALDIRIDSIVAAAGGDFSSIEARLTTVETATASLETDKAEASVVSTLSTTVTNNYNTLNTAITTEASSRTTADATLGSRATALESRRSAVRNLLSKTDWQVANVKTDITWGLAKWGLRIVGSSGSPLVPVATLALTGKVKANTTYSLRAKAKLTAGAGPVTLGYEFYLSSQITGSSNATIDTTEVDLMWEGLTSASSDMNTAVFRFYASLPAGKTIEITDVMLVESVTASIGYVPAPEDTDSKFAETVARIATEETTRATETGALATRATSLEASMTTVTGDITDIDARIATEETTRADETEALATSVDSLEARMTTAEGDINTAEASITTESTARATADSALASRATSLESRMTTAEGGITTNASAITSEASTRSTADTTLTNSINTLTSTVSTNNTTVTAAISSEASTRASADTALSTRATTLESKIVTAPNLVYNGGFALGKQSWTAPVGADDAYWAAAGLSTSQYGSHVYSNTGAGGATRTLVSDAFTVVAASSYTIQAELYTGAMTAGSINFAIEWFNVSDASLGVTATLTRANNNANWGVVTGTYVAPANTTKAKVKFWTASGTTFGGGGFAGIRKVKVELGTAITLFTDESTLGKVTTLESRIATEETTRASADTTLASRATSLESRMTTAEGGITTNTSRIATEETTRASADTALATRATTLEAKVIPNPNLLYNPTFSRSLENWSAYRTAGTDWTVNLATAVGDYLEKTSSASGGGTYNGHISNKVAATATTAYVISADLKTTGMTGGTLKVDVEWFTSGDVSLGASTAITLANGTGWTRQSATFTSPATTAKASVRVYISNATNTAASVKRIKLEQGSIATPYSDETTLGVGLNTVTASIVSEASTRASADTAMASNITTLQSDVGSASSRITTLETAVTTPTTGLVSRTGALETTINTPTTGLSARLTTAETAIVDLNTNSAAITAVNALQAYVTTNPNLLPNSTFGFGSINWTLNGAWTVSTTTDDGPSCQTTTGGSLTNTSDYFPATAAAAYSLAADILATGLSAGTVRCFITWYNGVTSLGTSSFGSVSSSTTGWSRVAVENIVAPANTTQGKVTFGTNGATLTKAGFRRIKVEKGIKSTGYTEETDQVVTNTKIATVDALISTPTTGIAARTTAIESALSTPTTGLSARVGTVETSVTDLATNKADASRVTTLESVTKTGLANLLPADFTGDFWTEATSGSPAGVAALANGRVVTVAGFGSAYERSTSFAVGTRGVAAVASGKVYEVRIEFEVVSITGGDALTIRSYVRGLDGSYASLGTTVAGSTSAASTGIHTVTGRFSNSSSTGIVAWPGSSVWLRFYAELTGTVTTSTVRVRKFSVIDVTTVVAAEARLTSLETTITTPTTGLSARTTALETSINTATTGIAARLTTAETTIVDLNTNKASASSVTSLTSTVNTKNKTYSQTTAPSSGMTTGDIWFDSDDTNKAYRYNGSAWVATDDTRIAANTAAITTEATTRADADTALSSSISTVSATANAKNRTFSQTTAPVSAMVSGDLWFDTDDNNKAYRYNGTSWIATDDLRLAANAAAITTESTTRADADTALASSISTVSATANAKNKTFFQTTAPSSGMVTGDIWFDSDDANKMYRYSGSAWVSADNTAIAANAAAITAEATTRASGDSANASSITTLGTTVSGHTSTITTMQSSIDGVAAQASLKLDVNGNITGWDIYSGVDSSYFRIVSSNFSIVDPSNPSNHTTPFSVTSGVVYINNAMINNLSVSQLSTGTYGGTMNVGSNKVVIDGVNGRILISD